MDLSTVASFITLEPSQLFRAERFVEQGLKMYDSDGELTEAYLKEHLHGVTLDYAMHVLDETSTSYMDVAIHNQGGKFSAPTAGVYGVSSRPEIKKKIKEKVLKKNELAKKLKKMHKEEVENVEELYKGKHGQSEKEYQAGRSDAGKRISGDEKHGPASYTRRGVVDQKPTKPGEKPEHTPKLGSAEKNELAYRKSRLKKEDVEFVDNLIESGKFSDEEIEKIVEAQVARNNPEKYERDQEKNDTRSKKQKRMDDPNTGINSPAFKKFMQQQGM